MEKIQTLGKRASESAIKVLPRLYGQPVVNVAVVQKWTGFTRAGAQAVIDRFIELKILSPKDKDKSMVNRIFMTNMSVCLVMVKNSYERIFGKQFN